MKKIIILNFETAEVHVYDYDENVWEDCEEFMMSENIRFNDCQWMLTDNLKIEIH